MRSQIAVGHNQIDIAPIANPANPGFIKPNALGKAQIGATCDQFKFIGIGRADIDENLFIIAFNIAKTIDLAGVKTLPAFVFAFAFRRILITRLRLCDAAAGLSDGAGKAQAGRHKGGQGPLGKARAGGAWGFGLVLGHILFLSHSI